MFICDARFILLAFFPLTNLVLPKLYKKNTRFRPKPRNAHNLKKTILWFVCVNFLHPIRSWSKSLFTVFAFTRFTSHYACFSTFTPLFCFLISVLVNFFIYLQLKFKKCGSSSIRIECAVQFSLRSALTKP